MAQCQKCGKEVPEGRQYCVECDAMLAGAANPAPTQPEQPVQPVQPMPPVQGETANFAQPQPVQPQPAAPVDPNQGYAAPGMGSGGNGTQNIIKVVVGIVVAVAVFFGWQWFQGEQKWSTFKKNYNSSCTGGATSSGAISQSKAETYCSCTLDEMQGQFSRDQIYKFDEQMKNTSSEIPSELEPIIMDCAKKIM